MNISKYVGHYLQSENEVSVRGLGSFRKNRIAGRFDHESGSFLPPSSTLIYTSEESDSLKFDTYVASQEHITIEEASRSIEDFSKETLTKLNNGERVEIEDLGSLFKDENNIGFESKSESEDDFFGFPIIESQNLDETSSQKIEYSPIQEVDNIEEEIQEGAPSDDQEIIQEIHDVAKDDLASDEATKEPNISEIETVIPSQSSTEEIVIPSSEETIAPAQTDTYTEQLEEEPVYEEENKSGFLKWVIILFILLVGIALAYMAKPELFERFTNQPQSIEEPIVNSIDTIVPDSLLDTIAPIVTPQEVVLQGTTTYEIVVSAEKKQSRIDQIVSNFEKMGYKVKVLPGKTIKKISVGSYLTHEEARDSLEVVRKKLNNPEAYIYPLTN